jgi:hypothetical protein
MGFCALSDLALVCLSSTSVYQKDYNGNGVDSTEGYTLNINALENVSFGDKTIEDLEFDGKVWPKGSRLSNMFKREDDMGWRIKHAESFPNFAREVAAFGLHQLHVALTREDEHLDFKYIVKNTMEQTHKLAKQKISVK